MTDHTAYDAIICPARLSCRVINERKHFDSNQSDPLTSERWSHGEVMVVYSQELLRFRHWRFCHVWTSFVNRAVNHRKGTCGHM